MTIRNRKPLIALIVAAGSVLAIPAMAQSAKQQAAHAQPRPRIFQPRRSIHHDVAAARAGGAPVAAHAGIDRGAFDHGVGIIQLDTGPLQALRAALGIGGGFGHAGISGRAGRANVGNRREGGISVSDDR